MGVMKMISTAVSEWAQDNLPLEVRRNINVATYDLLFGPTGSYEPDGDGWVYQGWEASLDIIRNAMEGVPPTAYFIPFTGDIVFSESEEADDCYILDIRKEILGQLSEYV